MKAKHLFLLLLTFGMMIAALPAEAQEPMHIKGNIKLLNKKDNTVVKGNERLWYGMYASREVAEKVQREVDRIANIEDVLQRESAFTALQKKEKLLGKTSATTRSFDENVMPGMALLFVTVLEYGTVVVEVKPGVTEYKDVVLSVQRISEVDVQGKMREGEVIGGGIVADADDGYENFPIRLNLPPSSARRDSRLIVQVYAVDCMTEDTVDYCRPFVAEGGEYHTLQNKRMAYNFYKNDKLAFAFDSAHIFDGEGRYQLSTMVRWKKKDTKRTYQGPFRLSLEDYHHVFKDTLIEGTCLRRRPFKLLDFSPALAQVELTRDFYEDAKSQVDKKKTDLSLEFKVGTDELTADSMNQVKLNRLVKELKSYGDQLMAPIIEGAASPDGSRSINEALARKRAERAKSMVTPYLPRHATPTVNVKVHTWNDVVELLEKQGHLEEANAIKDMSGDEGRMTAAVKSLPTYAEVVEPVLKQLRTMSCRYQVLRSYVMTPEECVEAWHKYKNDYVEGTKHFSAGDYYNLYNEITDSVELDELTLVAYREITQIPDYDVESKMAPYVANRMALINLRRGQPNSNLLAPFIDYSRPNINAKRPVDDMTVVTMNRREIVTNQAVTFYQEQKLDSANYLIRLLEKGNVKDKNVEMLKTLMDLKQLHFTNPGSPEYQAAKNNVLNANNDNKAILYTEIDEWGMQEEAPKYVDLMDDENPKKWYLKALLSVPGEGKSEAGLVGDDALDDLDGDTSSGDGGDECYPRVEDELEQMLIFDKSEEYYKAYKEAKQNYMDSHDGQLPAIGDCLNPAAQPADAKTGKEASEQENVSLENIPHYLAYMQGCFDLDPSFKKFYFAEGAIDEKLRKKYPWKKKNVQAYRLLFEKLQARDARLKHSGTAAQKNDDMMGGDEEETETKTDETASGKAEEEKE